MVNVFIPLLILPQVSSDGPKNELRKLDVTVDQAIKTIVSAGIIKLNLNRKKFLKSISLQNIFCRKLIFQNFFHNFESRFQNFV